MNRANIGLGGLVASRTKIGFGSLVVGRAEIRFRSLVGNGVNRGGSRASVALITMNDVVSQLKRSEIITLGTMDVFFFGLLTAALADRSAEFTGHGKGHSP